MFFRIHFLLLLAAFSGASSLCAQNFGNEWIHYDQQYWKFPITQDGLYRISYQSLANSGFPVSSVDPQFIQLFGRGKQSALIVSGQSDGSFDAEDYIEFYAQKNDAWLDSLIYEDPALLPNPDFSLFNDTAHYFITIGNTPGVRTNNSALNNFNDYAPASYCLYASSLEFHNQYQVGKQDVNGISLPTYDAAEGWFDYKFPIGGSHVVNVPTTHAYTGADAPVAKIECRSASASLASGFPNHHLQVGWGDSFQLAVDSMYYGYQTNKLHFTIPAVSLGANTTKITHRSIDDLNVPTDYHAVSFVQIDYARDFDFGDQSSAHFMLQNPALESYLLVEFTALPANDARLFVMQQSAVYEVAIFEENGLHKALIPTNAGAGVQLLITTNDFQQVQFISPVTQSGYFTAYADDELQDAFIILTSPLLLSASQNYGAWRNNSQTNSLIVNVDELYMQYAYGIWKHPLAIRRFCNELVTTWTQPPAHLFLLGKSILDANYGSALGSRMDAIKYTENLVPTWGFPGSDILFTAGLNGTNYEPAIPTGRLSARNNQQVLEYLNKVIEHETADPELWQKNILHFGGGTIEAEQFVFRNYLNNYKAIAQDTSMGAHVYSFFKNTSDPIQLNVSDSIQLLINEGVSVMTFFGHASSTGFDQNIDSPLSYNNQGKYPLLIGNSCYTGNIHLSDSQSASETFVLVPDRGVIGFLAKVDIGIPGYLDLYTNNFYREIFNYNYGKSIGYCMKKSIQNFQVNNDFYRANVAYNFALHGDPAIKIHPQEKPDYSIEPENVFFNPDDIAASATQFEVKVVVENLGKATNDDVSIELIRHYPNGVDSSYLVTVDRILNRDTITFNVPNNGEIAAGQNTFDVFVDYPLNLVDELNDASNNVVQGKTLFITSGDLYPVVPYAFAVIDNPQPVLKATTGFAFEPLRTYKIQADTTDLFNSPMLHATTIAQTGGVVEWPMPFALSDSMVVFWRCSGDSISPEQPYHWIRSSFQYIASNEGWGQQHFFQFREDVSSNLGYDPLARTWSFEPTQAQLKCEVYGDPQTAYEGLATRYQLNLNVQDYAGYGFDSPALMVAVLDSSTFAPWESNYNGENPQYDFGNTLISANARNRAEKYFIFQQDDAAQLDGFSNMIDQIPNGNYLLIYTWLHATKSNWDLLDSPVSETFQSLGANTIMASPDSVPFIFFMKKGYPLTVQEVVGSDISDYIVLQSLLQGSLGNGVIKSPVVGPAVEWGKAEWKLDALGSANGDSSLFFLHGISWNGNDQLLTQWPQNPDVINDLSSVVDVDQFPYLRLEARVNDFENYTAPQLDQWHVLYDHAPECAINPQAGFYLANDTVDQGENLLIAIAIQNISAIAMDSLKVNYRIEDNAKNNHKLIYPIQKPLLPGEILLDTLEISTVDYPGLNRLYMEANPIDSATMQPHQPEQYHFNNLAQIDFFVIHDLVNPLLDVTFDGQHILNGDIVSAKPHILISLDDENEYFILNEEADTTHFRVYLKKPETDYIALYFSSPELEWTPASAPTNKFKIDYLPEFAIDGTYSLRVQASDKSGNVSGDNDYIIDFEIFSKPTITEVMNYPNPFSTRTQFVFTLTGTEPPDQFKIQIMNISGDIVREITQDEIGPLRIGRNLSEYWWNGRDEFGDQLANGVYLYRVVARYQGENIELNETTASRYFNRGFGKMYLFR